MGDGEWKDGGASAAWPLIGRERELEYVGERLGGPGVVVAGAPGVGKTRLAGDVVGSLDEPVVWVRATATAAGIPLGAVAQHLGSVDDTAGPLSAPAAYARLVARIDAGRGRRSAPNLVVVDDAHWLDDTTATMLHQLCTNGDARLLLTLRPGAECPEAIVALWKDRVIERVELQPLSFSEMLALLDVVVGPLEPRTAQRLWSASAGNPLYLRELVDDGLRTGSLRRVGDAWQFEGNLVQPGGRLADIVSARLASLTAAERDVLGLVAVGEPLPVTSLERVVAAADLASLEARGMIRSADLDGVSEVRLAHPIYGELIRAAAGELELRRTYERLVALLGDTRSHRERVRVAYWSMQAGLAVDARTFSEAAATARTAQDAQRARLVARAAQHGESNVEAQLLAAESFVVDDRFAEAALLLAGIVDETTDDALQYRIAKAQSYALTPRGLPATIEAIDRSMQRASSPDGRHAIATVRVQAMSSAGDTRAALAEGSALVDSAPNDTGFVLAVAAVAPSLIFAGRTSEQIALAERAETALLSLSGNVPTATTPAIFSTHLFGLLFDGQPHRAMELVRLLEAMAQSHGSTSYVEGYLAVARGRIALALGRPGTAIAELTQATAGLGVVTHLGGSAWALALLGEAYALVGRDLDARRCATASEALVDPHRQRYEIDRQRALAWIDACAGRLQLGVERMLQYAGTSEARGELGSAASLLYDAVRLGDRSALLPLDALHERVDGSLTAARADVVRGVASRDGERQLAGARQLHDLGFDLEAAEAAHRAAGAYRERGLAAKQQEASRFSSELLARCERARTPALGAPPSVVGLTQREREVVRLAARGLTNKAVAGELHIATRTVEGHLARAFAKLGVASRSDLGMLFDA
ncbi:MAG TPA: LuxR C-terminal-related transcriptional regulator [Acidimicrobiia bacterium]